VCCRAVMATAVIIVASALSETRPTLKEATEPTHHSLAAAETNGQLRSLEVGGDCAGQLLEEVKLSLVEACPGCLIEDAEDANSDAGRRDEGDAGIEAIEGVAHDEGKVVVPGVEGEVRDHGDGDGSVGGR